jgi:putative PIN family toxin of toxin-antitoxin system
LPPDGICAIISLVKVTVDTNILYQAVCSRLGASNAILQLVRSGDLKLAISVPVYEEYCAVLTRPQVRRATGLSQLDIDAILEFIALAGMPTPIDFLWRPNLNDESDNMFVELAIASGSEYLITRNRRHYSIGNQLRFDSFTVVTPAEFLTQWRKIHG